MTVSYIELALKLNDTYVGYSVVCSVNNVRAQNKELKPNAISGMYNMSPLLCDSYPEYNIHLWHTPKEYVPENVEYTREMCNRENVKIVLVDYPVTIDYFL